MEPNPLLTTEVVLGDSCKRIDTLPLPNHSQPGATLVLDGQTYTILERRHRYRFRAGRYQLHRIVLYVQTAPASDRTQIGDRWVLGDVTCRYNARSELMRCAVSPAGPCQGCSHYEPRDA
ncbi:MAG: DUF6464 family protein [Elainellaceae cyanobacterium]